ncbi:MAG: cupin domain-containing protein [Lachnospiraceae bacterium]|nr:cupin domain-containing protein [Candidatus Equihabitans merdae]
MFPVIHETDVTEKAVPGRYLRWVVDKTSDEGLDGQYCSCVIMRVEPGKTVTPAHSHPNGEEMLYIISGHGKTYIDGKIYSFEAGSVVMFEQGKIHIVRNTGDEELKVACFYGPATSLDEYEFHPEVDFDSGVEV